jgi:hypothetical protein
LNGSSVFLTILSHRLDQAAAARLRADLPGAEVTVCAALEREETYVYLRTPPESRARADAGGADAAGSNATGRRAPVSDAPSAITARMARHYPGCVTVELTMLKDIPGASAAQSAHWHYIVETDVLPEALNDLNAWYDEEHLPGLAAVPGTVHAWRYERPGGQSPRYIACYDLVTAETFGSPPWLAVRASAWSDRVRPTFRNTRRAMFKLL